MHKEDKATHRPLSIPYQLVNWSRQATHTEHLRRRRVTDNGPAFTCYGDVAIYIKLSMKCGFDLHHHVWWPSQVILGEPHRKMQCTVTGYRNWCKDCGHCGVTKPGTSPQPRGKSLMTPQWPTSMYQFLFNHIKQNLWLNARNCQKTVLIAAWLHVHRLPLFHGVRWPDCSLW